MIYLQYCVQSSSRFRRAISIGLIDTSWIKAESSYVVSLLGKVIIPWLLEKLFDLMLFKNATVLSFITPCLWHVVATIPIWP